jgi:hypothetical protein
MKGEPSSPNRNPAKRIKAVVRELEHEDVEKARPEEHAREQVHDVRVERLIGKILDLPTPRDALEEKVRQHEADDVGKRVPTDSEVTGYVPEEGIELVDDPDGLPPLFEIRSRAISASHSMAASRGNPSKRTSDPRHRKK